MNSNFAIARSYLGDITDETNRVRGFSFVGLMWGAGAVVGPSTGGLLSNPGDHVELSDDHFLRRYPYILPSIVSGILSLISWLVAYFLLQESNKAVLLRKQQQEKQREKQIELKELVVSSDSLLSEEDGETKEPAKRTSKLESASAALISKEEREEQQKEKEQGGEEEEEGERSDKQRSVWAALRAMWRGWRGGGVSSKKNKYAHLDLAGADGADDSRTVSTELSPTTPPAPVPEEEEGKEKKSNGDAGETKKKGISETLEIFKDRSVVVCIVLLSLSSTCVVAIDELFPLWAKYKPPVGIDFDSSKIGLSWAIGGVTLVLFQGILYPRLANRVGLLTLVRFGSLGFVIDYLSFPMLSLLADRGFLLWLALGAVLFGRYITGASVGTSLNILVNTVGGEKVRKHRGVVNGVAMSVSGLARASAPVLGSSLFAWSNTNQLAFPFNHYFVFEVMGSLLVLVFLLSFLISKKSIQ